MNVVRPLVISQKIIIDSKDFFNFVTHCLSVDSFPFSNVLRKGFEGDGDRCGSIPFNSIDKKGAEEKKR